MGRIKMVRFDAKMTPAHKQLIEKAARVRGFKSLTEYVVTTMVEQSVEAIERFESYSTSDRARIMEILSEPTELSASFLKSSRKRSKNLKDADSDRVTLKKA